MVCSTAVAGFNMVKIGRPPASDLDDPVVVEEICARLVAGSSVAQVCASDDMPAESTFYVKMAKDESFRSAIARARELQQEAEIDRTIDMADAATPEDWQVVRMRIWARQWRAAKLAPKKYGDVKPAPEVLPVSVTNNLLLVQNVTKALMGAKIVEHEPLEREGDET